MHAMALYSFRLRHERTGKWYTARHKMTLEEAATRHGQGNYELIEDSKVVRQVYPLRASAAHLQSRPGFRSGN